MTSPFEPEERPDEFSRFDDLEAPDQWDAIMRRAETMSSGEARPAPHRRRRNAWILVAAAVTFALVGGLVLLQSRAGDDAVVTDTPGASNDADEPTADESLPTIPSPGSTVPGAAGRSMDCVDLPAIVGLAQDGMPAYDYAPAEDLDTLVDRADAVVVADLDSIVREPMADSDDVATVFRLSSVESISGNAEINSFATRSVPDRSNADPLDEPVALTGIRVLAFLHDGGDEPLGWTVNVEGLYVGCATDEGPVVPVIEGPPPGADMTSVDALVASIRDVLLASAESLWSPSCVAQAGTAEAPSPDDILLEELGPLGAEPALELEVPALAGDDDGQTSDPFTTVTRIPGGLMMSIATRPAGPWILTAIDDDGSVRWRRCGSPVSSSLGALVAPYELEPDRILVNETQAIDSSTLGQWRTIDLTTGDDRPAPEGIQGTRVLGPPSDGSHHVLLGEPLGEQLIDTSTDQMLLVDLLTFETVEVPYPSDAEGRPASDFGFSVVDEGGPVVVQLDFTGGGEVLGRYQGLEWRDPLDPVAGLVERVGFAGEPDEFQLEGVDEAGDPVWVRDDLTNPGDASGSSGLVDGLPGTTVVRVCVQRGDGGCTDQALVGVDNETGETVWTQEPADIESFGRDVAIVSADGEYRMIDNATGELIGESQRWTTTEFLGADEVAAATSGPEVSSLGGIVLVTAGDTIRVWYPEPMSDGTVRVGLADGG